MDDHFTGSEDAQGGPWPIQSSVVVGVGGVVMDCARRGVRSAARVGRVNFIVAGLFV